MTGLRLPMAGRCRCGEVRIEIAAPPILTMACHCTGCQRMSASAYSLSAAIPSDGFRVLEGAPVIGGLRGEPRHHFCPSCMSWMFTRMPVVGFVNVRPTMLDDASWFSPFVETYLSERLPWASTPAVHGFQAFPAFEDWARLSEAYAAQAEPPVA